MHTSFRTTRLKRGFQLLPFILLLVVSSAFAQFTEYEDLVPRYPNQMDGRVNMVEGRFSFAGTDLVVPGRGLSIEFTRYYHGTAVSDRYRSYLGQGWSHTYQWQLNYERKTNDAVVENYWHIITGSGAQQSFKDIPNRVAGVIPAGATLTPEPGVRASLECTTAGVFIYTTKSGIKYQFEHYPADAMPKTYQNYVLTNISDPNGNTITLHYENSPDASPTSSTSRLIAVEDELGRFLKFYYELEIAGTSYPRYISKIEYGLGTAQALTTVYQTIKYTQTKTIFIWLTSVRRQLDATDPLWSELETELITQYQYDSTHGVSVITTPLGHRTEIDSTLIDHKSRVMRVRVEDGSTGTVLHERQYGNGSDLFDGHAYNRDSQTDKRRDGYHCNVSGGLITVLTRKQWPDPPFTSTNTPTDIGSFNWLYDDKRNITTADYRDEANGERKWQYIIYYEGSNAAHNKQMGNATKWEQVETTDSDTTVTRKWEADYETTYNRPIWQIDVMGHKTEFSYDTNGNVTEVRSKANTGTPTPCYRPRHHHDPRVRQLWQPYQDHLYAGNHSRKGGRDGLRHDP